VPRGFFEELGDLVRRGPVVGARALDGWRARPRIGAVRAVGAAPSGAPVPPLSVWGVPYEVDLVLRTAHPDFDMHEIAKVRTADGPLWLWKDARAAGLAQTIVADRDDIGRLLPEVPVERRAAPMRVVDASDARTLRLDVTTSNVDGVPVRLVWDGPRPRPVWLRNSSTMGHSADAVAALLDLSAMALGASATLEIGGRRWAPTKIAGVVPFAVALQQTQGGLAMGTRTVDAEGRRWGWAAWAPGQQDAQTDVMAAPSGEGLRLQVQDAWRTLRHSFVGDDATAWEGAEVWAPDGRLVASVASRPAIPDVRRPWTGPAFGELMVSVGGQRPHGRATWQGTSDRDGARLLVTPTSPSWFAARAIEVTVRRGSDGVTVQAKRLPRG
jgi:hypothetical protein